MSNVVRTAIAAELALLEPVVELPAAPFGYGSDLSCDSDLTATMEEVDGSTTLALAQALFRRLDTPRGSLPDDKTYGIDLRSYCNRATSTAEIRELGARVRTELTQDDRVDAVSVVVTPATDGSSLAVQIGVTPVDPALGPFAMALAVTSSTVVLEAMVGA